MNTILTAKIESQNKLQIGGINHLQTLQKLTNNLYMYVNPLIY